jgi:hypothetical protein
LHCQFEKCGYHRIGINCTAPCKVSVIIVFELLYINDSSSDTSVVCEVLDWHCPVDLEGNIFHDMVEL